MRRWCIAASVVILTLSVVGCASNGRPLYQTGPGWEYYYDHFRPELDHIGANNSAASGAAYDTDPEYFFWNHVKTAKLVLGMKDEAVLQEAALRPDKIYRNRDKQRRQVELWVYRRDQSAFLRTDEDIPTRNVLIVLQFVNGRLVGWEPETLPVLSPENLLPVSNGTTPSAAG